MSKFILPVAVVVALAAVVAITPPAAFAGSGSGSGGTTETRVEGTVSSVNAAAGTLVITTRGGTQVTVVTNAGTKIERNDARATLAAFKVGDRGQARVGTGGVATKVEAVGP